MNTGGSWRHLDRVNQSQFAKKAGVSRTHLSAALNAKEGLSLDTCQKIAAALKSRGEAVNAGTLFATSQVRAIKSQGLEPAEVLRRAAHVAKTLARTPHEVKADPELAAAVEELEQLVNEAMSATKAQNGQQGALKSRDLFGKAMKSGSKVERDPHGRRVR